MAEDLSRAEAFAAKRGLVCLLFSLASLCFTLVTILQLSDGPIRGAQVLLWAIWLIVPLVWVFGRPGGWRLTRQERAIINDELVRANQHRAARYAMVIMAAGLAAQCAGVFGYITLPLWWPLAVLSLGLAGAGIAFAIIELRSA